MAFQLTPQEVEEYNAMVRRWSAMVRRKLHISTSVLRKGKSGPVIRGKYTGFPRTENKLSQSLMYMPRYTYGQIDSISYRFERHGVFVHKGVGKGHIIIGNTVVRGVRSPKNGKGRNRKEERDAASTLLTGSIKRHPVDWFNAIIDKNVPELADKVAQLNADAAVNALRLRIV